MLSSRKPDTSRKVKKRFVNLPSEKDEYTGIWDS
jgi:hypothetical protein